MAEIEREIKLLNVNPIEIMEKMRSLGIKPKWKYVQDIYTYDFPNIKESLESKISEFKKKRGQKKNNCIIKRNSTLLFRSRKTEYEILIK